MVAYHREDTRFWDVSVFPACQTAKHSREMDGACQSLGWFRWGCKLKDPIEPWWGAHTGIDLYCLCVLVGRCVVGQGSVGECGVSFAWGGEAEEHMLGRLKRSFILWHGGVTKCLESTMVHIEQHAFPSPSERLQHASALHAGSLLCLWL